MPLVLACAFFFVSGFPALIYQLVWQRSLFAIYGINVESVTVVVTAFMLGLGLGSVLGGVISRSKRMPLLTAFGIVEFGIGAFGAFSLGLFDVVGSATLTAPPAATALLTFLLVLLPTLLMGATLPILTAHLVKHTRNVGRSVGLLYFVNTLGSAAACFAVALFIMREFGMAGSVRLAAGINLAVAAGAFLVSAMTRPGADGAETEPAAEVAEKKKLWPAALLVAAVGFISLSYEILWYRVHSFASGGSALAFATMLGAFLFGIAVGSLVARQYCTSSGGQERRAIVFFVLVASGVAFLVAPFSAWVCGAITEPWRYALLLPPVAAAAGLMGALFPLICHFGVAPDARAGSGLSWLYLANIVGGACGSLLTGFVLMDAFGLAAISQLLAVLGAVLAAALALLLGLGGRVRLAVLGVSGLTAAVALLGSGVFFGQFYEKLQPGYDRAENGAFADIVENRSGVVTVTHDGVVYGGGMYDGAFSTDLVNDANMIVRAYSLAAFHESPRRVLMIGLSSGSWAQVIAHHPAVESLTVVEINPGYPALMARHGNVASLLQNPKVEIVIDDGRRWLHRHPDERFDAIIMNTTWHWRAHCTNLLSREFLELVRTHLSPGGVCLYNTTGSPEVQRTACAVFPHVVRVLNNVVVSDSRLMPDRARWRQALLAWRIDGRAVMDLSRPADRETMDKVMGLVESIADAEYDFYAMETRSSILARTEGARIITDDNMGTEWDLGREN